jgi:hypothetical protein
MSNNNIIANFPLPLSTILFVVFLVLKLTDHINWSWWWIFSPLWISAIFVSLFFSISVLLFFIIKKRMPKISIKL